MATLISILISFTLLTIAWHCWKITLRDWVRDRLFDLRDEWRTYWVATGRDMNAKTYKDVRDYLNNYLRYTNDLRFVTLFYLKIKNPLLQVITADHNKLFATPDADLSAVIQKIRLRAAFAVQAYMCFTSLLAVGILFIAIVSLFPLLIRHPIKAAMSAVMKLSTRFKVIASQRIDAAVKIAD
jgi:D-alanyl-lipoteichoic acid acyltransferase DltB (MBOAT superfamily)